MKMMSAFDAFKGTQQTLAEAEEKAKVEAGRPKVERFRIGEDGEYPIRILPLAPNFDSQGNVLPMDRKGYEYPVHQFFLGINLPSKQGGTKKKITIPVVRATDKGIDKSVDLIDTYLKIAKEKYGDDTALVEAIDANGYTGGLRWNYAHAIMVLDLSSDKERAKGPQIWQCSHSQYKDIDAAKLRLWKELEADGGQSTCPISGFANAYPIKMIRKTENSKSSYTVEIARKTSDIKEEELSALLELPRIPELIYSFTLYSLEAEIVFLKQYDELHDIEVCSEPDFEEAVEKLKGELPADDTRHFDLASAGKSGSAAAGEVTIDSLWSEYDHIVDNGLSEKSEEYQELREKLRQFAEDNDLDVRLSRSKNNKQLLEEIEDALDEKGKQTVAEPTAQAEKEVEETSAEEAEEEEVPVEDKAEAEEPAEEQPARRRRPRPADDEEERAPEEQPEPAEETPVVRRRRRSS